MLQGRQEVATVHVLLQVLELAVRHQPAVIILDLKQHVDGRDLLAALKRDPRTKDIKVLVLSAIEDQFTRHVCLELGRTTTT